MRLGEAYQGLRSVGRTLSLRKLKTNLSSRTLNRNLEKYLKKYLEKRSTELRDDLVKQAPRKKY